MCLRYKPDGKGHRASRLRTNHDFGRLHHSGDIVTLLEVQVLGAGLNTRPCRIGIPATQKVTAGVSLRYETWQVPGTKLQDLGPRSKRASAGNDQNSYRGLVKIMKGASVARDYSQCDSLLIGDKCGCASVSRGYEQQLDG